MALRSSTSNPLLLFVIAACSLILIPALFMDGMFMDGLLYTCVGKNLGNGVGTFWDPQFSTTYMQSYHEQPPLLFGMLAVFFRLFGNSLYTERIYCLCMAILCFCALRMMWMQLSADRTTQSKRFWLPLLLFFTSPVTFYAYINNVEEASMVVFALLSAAFQLKAIRTPGNTYGWFAVGGLALIASSMCKGMQGLFPLIIPATWFIVMRGVDFPLRKAMIGSAIVIGVPALFYLAISRYEPAAHSYSAYFHDRIAATFNVQSTATTGNRFFLLYELLLDLLPALFISVLLAVASRKITRTFRKEGLFLLIIGFAGILPLMVTLEQRGFYLVTGLPFITSALALFALDGAERIETVIEQKRWLKIGFRSMTVLLFTTMIASTLLLAGTPKRDVDLIHDVRVIGTANIGQASISAYPETWSNWSLQGYLQRYADVSLSRTDTTTHFFIVQGDQQAPKGFSRVQLDTRYYHLYAR